MNILHTDWILCPACHGKTRTQLRSDTVLENFPLFCPKCKQTFLIAAHNGRVERALKLEESLFPAVEEKLLRKGAG